MMSPRDLAATAARALTANPLRSALTALGVIIGVASVVAMVALGRGAQEKVEASIASLGSNLIIVTPGAISQGGVIGGAGGRNTLTLADAEAIAREISGVVAVAPVQRASGQIVADGANWSTRFEGVTPDYAIARDWDVSDGVFFEERDLRQARKVVLLGASVADQLFPNADPIGRQVRINKTAFTVTGVLQAKGQSGFGQDQDDVVLMPFTTIKRRVSGRVGRPNTVSQISIKAASENDMARVEQDAIALLRQRHRITGKKDDDFSVRNLGSIAAAAQETTSTFTVLLASIAGVSLFVGGVGIMNIMLVSVTERTREIGLRKALGARQADILRQFALEAVALSLAGGLIGLLLGVGAAYLITTLADLPFALGPSTGILALGFSVFVGLVFGAYPAWRAAKLDPIEALRRE